jgi:hypothetical protein
MGHNPATEANKDSTLETRERRTTMKAMEKEITEATKAKTTTRPRAAATGIRRMRKITDREEDTIWNMITTRMKDIPARDIIQTQNIIMKMNTNMKVISKIKAGAEAMAMKVIAANGRDLAEEAAMEAMATAVARAVMETGAALAVAAVAMDTARVA